MTPVDLSLQILNGVPMLPAAGLLAAPGRIRSWLYRFSDDEALNQALPALLSEDELMRAQAFVAPGARRHYVQGRAVLRLLLAGILKCPPRNLHFDYGPYGKPELRDAANCRFNIAHSGDYALLAVAQGISIGVDIEQQRETADLDALARMVFSPAEADHWSTLPKAERKAFFFSIWTAKEALVKATGRGLGLGPQALDVGRLPPNAPAAGHAIQLGEPGAGRLWPLAAPPGYAAALAVHEPG